MTNTVAKANPENPSVRYIFFGLAALGLLMSSIDSTIVAVAIPALTSSLDTSLNWVGWTMTGYQLTQVVVMPLIGRLSDELGRKRVFMFCIGSFTIGSLLCALAPNIGFLILFRVIQALGGGGLMPSAVGIVSDQFKERRMQAIGLFSSIFPIGGIIGPNLGGWIIQNWSWREIFTINLPIGLVVFIGAQFVLRAKRQTVERQPIDFLGLALYAGAMLALMYAMTAAGTDPTALRSPLIWLLVIGSLLLFVLFIRQERRTDHPIVEIQLLARMPFLPANIYNFVYGIAVLGLLSFVPYFAVVQYHMSTVQSGAVLTPRSLALTAVAAVSSLFILRAGYRKPMVAGTLIVGLSLALLGQGWNRAYLGPLELDGFWLMAVEVAIAGVGMGLATPAANNASIDMLPGRAAAITGLRGMFRITGGIMGVSTTVLVLSFFPDQAAGMRTLFFVVALVLQLTIPLILLIPDSARERRRWQAAGTEGMPEQSPGKVVAINGKPD